MTAVQWDGRPEVMPPGTESGLQPLHQREYLVRSFKIDDTSMLIGGAVMDVKPGQMFADRINALGGSDDGRPMAIHHMLVDLVVSFPELVITGVTVAFEVHPQPTCPFIAASYEGLVGLPVARGFTHKVRELFGGPRGCTHTTALLQAMAPVALQSIFSMRRPQGSNGSTDDQEQPAPPPENSFMRDTCHVWSTEGELWQMVTVGKVPPIPLPMQARLVAAGLEPGAFDPRRAG